MLDASEAWEVVGSIPSKGLFLKIGSDCTVLFHTPPTLLSDELPLSLVILPFD